LEEALYLSNIASEVVIVHQRNKFRGEKILAAQLTNKSNVKIEWNHIVDEIIGNATGVTGIRITEIGKASKIIELKGVFIAIGHAPNTAIFNARLAMKDGYIKVRGRSEGAATVISI
jgi:thioredoxin reductase (NADPH)